MLIHVYIYRALSEVVGEPLPYDTLDEVRDRLNEISPALVAYGQVNTNNYYAQARELAQVSEAIFNILMVTLKTYLIRFNSAWYDREAKFSV